MNATQQWVTGLMALLMLGTILAMPAQTAVKTAESNRTGGWITPASQVGAELPQELVRDLTYN